MPALKVYGQSRPKSVTTSFYPGVTLFGRHSILVIKYVAATLLTANKKQNCNKLLTDSLGEREFQFSFSEQHAERRFCHHFSHPSVLDSRVTKTNKTD